MLTHLITQRFAKHHNYLLASLDALEATVQEISQSSAPADEFLAQKAGIHGILEFLAVDEAQHEREEEQVLVPVLHARLDQDLPSVAVLEQVAADHRWGQELVRQAAEHLEKMESAEELEPRDFILLNSRLSDIVWHYRRHVWKENAIILPTTRRVVPDHADGIWAASPPRQS